MMGVVYYANYLRYFEAGRNELLRSLNIDYKMLESSGFFLPVARVFTRYHQPARYDEELSLDTSIAEIRTGSVRMAYRLFRDADGALIATGETMHACVGPSGRVRRLPEELRDKLGLGCVASTEDGCEAQA